MITIALLFLICLNIHGKQSSFKSDCSFLDGPVDSSRMLCGTLEVPENHDKPNGRKISIAYVILKSENPDTREYPMIYFTGGPGGQALTNMSRRLAHPILKTRDIIFFDQRGIGKSSPLPDLTTKIYSLFAENLTIGEERKRIAGFVNDLRKTCDELGIEIEMYNTFQNAKDVGMLMDHLGYEKYNLRGGSYGTRLARFVADYFPEKINAAIYDSPAPYRSDYLLSRLEDYSNALRKVFDYCQNNEQCNSRYPDLEEAYHSELKKLADQPLELKSYGSPFFLNPQDAIFVLRYMLYASASRQLAPRFIDALRKNDLNWLERVVRSVATRDPGSNWAMFLACENYEEYDPKVTADVLAAKYKELDLLPYELPVFGSLYLGSANFLRSSATRRMKAHKVSDVPSLIFVNQYDPVTPPKNAAVYESQMTNVHAFIIDAGGHGGGDMNCKRSIMDAFMSNPEAELSTGCLKLYKQ